MGSTVPEKSQPAKSSRGADRADDRAADQMDDHGDDGSARSGEPGRSGVGVLDKSVALVEAVAAAPGPCSLADLVALTGISRATAHRLAVALETHRLLRRTPDGRFALGLRLLALGRAAADDWPLADIARPALEGLRDVTGESVQLYVREGDHRVCLASLDSGHELRTIVEEGARLPLGRGSAGRLLAGEVPATGYSASTGERAPGVGSVSAPIVIDGELVAAVGVSGPLDRLGSDPGPRFGPAVIEAADAVVAAVVAMDPTRH